MRDGVLSAEYRPAFRVLVQRGGSRSSKVRVWGAILDDFGTAVQLADSSSELDAFLALSVIA